MTHRSTVVVRITTDDGIVGEAYAGDEDSSLLEIDRIVNEELAPKLLGEDAYAIERCWELVRPATFRPQSGVTGAVELPIAFLTARPGEAPCACPSIPRRATTTASA